MKRRYSIKNIIVVIDVILFAALIIGIFIIGGTAADGKIENGKYYIWDVIVKYKNGIKAYIEVSRAVYIYSTIHFYLVIVTSILFSVTKVTEWVTATTQKWRNKRSFKSAK